jgi:AraC-like DNA-binding protein
MGLLIPDWFTNARILWLPYGRSAPVNAAMRHAMDHLADAGIEPSAAAAGLSPRTLRRRFLDEVGMTWRQFVREARLTRALDLLARQELKVGDVAHAVGFRSLASFNQAVRQWTGRSPGSYLRDRHPPGDLPRENELPG